MKKLSDEYSLEDWRKFVSDTTYAMLCAHERAREVEYAAQLAAAEARIRALEEDARNDTSRLAGQAKCIVSLMDERDSARGLLREACNVAGDSSNLYCGAWVSTGWIKRARAAGGGETEWEQVAQRAKKEVSGG